MQVGGARRWWVGTWLAADDGVGADGLVGLELLLYQVAHAAHVHGLRLHLRVDRVDGLVAHAVGLGDELRLAHRELAQQQAVAHRRRVRRVRRGPLLVRRAPRRRGRELRPLDDEQLEEEMHAQQRRQRAARPARVRVGGKVGGKVQVRVRVRASVPARVLLEAGAAEGEVELLGRELLEVLLQPRPVSECAARLVGVRVRVGVRVGLRVRVRVALPASVSAPVSSSRVKSSSDCTRTTSFSCDSKACSGVRLGSGQDWGQWSG